MKAISRYIGLVSILIGALAASGVTARAHHSFAPFDLTMERTITGTVSRFEWTNPHSWIWVDVPNDKGGVDAWAIEGMSPNYLARRGWSKSTLKPGEKITVSVRPLKNGDKGGMFVRATLSDGRVLTQSGQPTD